METKLKSLKRYFRAVKMYLDDIERIVTVLADLPGTSEITIETENYRYASVEDLGKSPEERCSEISVAREGEGYSRRIYVWVSEEGAGITADYPEAAERGAYYEIVELLLARQRLKRSWSRVFVSFLIAAAFVWVVWWSKNLTLADWVVVLGLNIIANAGFWAVVYMWVGWAPFWRSLRSVVILRRRENYPSFWERNKDKIALEVFKGIGAAIAGSLITLVIQRFFSKPCP